MYLDFNVSIKKIKLRDTLTKIMGLSDVYLRSKVPEDMFDTLQKFAEIRKADRASIVRDFDLFPITQNLLTLERKYGDSLNFEDLNGFKQRKKRRQKSALNDSNMTAGGGSDMQSETQFTETRTKTDAVSDAGLSMQKRSVDATVVQKTDEDYDDEVEEKKIKRNPDTDCKNDRFEHSLRDRTMGASVDFM
jgi:hypothetical protein